MATHVVFCSFILKYVYIVVDVCREKKNVVKTVQILQLYLSFLSHREIPNNLFFVQNLEQSIK